MGVQAAQRISQAADPLKLLADISQSFPTLVSSLSKLPVNKSLAGEVRANQQQIPSGDPGTFLLFLCVALAEVDFCVIADLYASQSPCCFESLPVLSFRRKEGDHQQWAVHSVKHRLSWLQPETGSDLNMLYSRAYLTVLFFPSSHAA